MDFGANQDQSHSAACSTAVLSDHDPYYNGPQITEMHLKDAYERCHPGDTFHDLENRAHFSKEDRGLLNDWMAAFDSRGHQQMPMATPVRRIPAKASQPEQAGQADKRLVELGEDGVEVDAAVIAKGFKLNPDQVLDQLRSRAITSRYERGTGEDEGRNRLTFFSRSRRLQIIVDDKGALIQRRMIDFGQNPLPATLRSSVE